MSDEIVESRSVCKYNAGINCAIRACSKCGFNPEVKRKRLNKIKYQRRGELPVRLIDANALKMKQHGALRWLSGLDIEAAPTIDAVPVIRCKDCAYCVKKDMFGRGFIYECKQTLYQTQLDDFCSMAKRRAINDD